MRILYILNATDPYGGATKALMHLTDGIIGTDVQVLFILPSDSGIANGLRERGIPYRILDYRMAVYPPTQCFKDVLLFIPRLLGRICLNRRAAKQVALIAREFHADIIHTNTSVNDIGYIASRILHIPHVWHIREYADLYFKLYFYPSRTRYIQQFKSPDSYTICITKDIQQYNGLQDCPTSRVIYDGVLHESQSAFLLPKHRSFLFAGRLEPGKGIEELLHAYARYSTLTKKPIPLQIAGDTQDEQYKSRLETIVQQSGTEALVTFLGERKDILDLMQCCMALIVPSRAEGFGFVTTEGMFSGALVIGRNTRGTKEQFDNGLALSGQEIALRYNTPDELIDLLCRVTDEGLIPYLTMAKTGQSVAKQLYSVESHVKAVSQFYNDILQHRQQQ